MPVLFDASKLFIESSEWIALELRNESSGITGDIASGNKKGWGDQPESSWWIVGDSNPGPWD